MNLLTRWASCGPRTILHLLSISSFFLKILESEGLRDVRLEAYRYTRLGEEITLRCSYDLEAGTLYAVKWYRGVEEFYRFIPKELRPKQVFPGTGISVDYFRSDDHHVLLRNASFETSGKYKCSVSIEGNFQTISDSKEITVVVIGYDAPSLVLRDLHYEPGSPGEATCRMHRTSPPVNMTWFINNEEVTKRVITRTEPDEEDDRISSTISVIYFTLPTSSYGPTFIKCRATLYDIYADASITRIQPRIPSSNSNSRKVLEVPNSLQHSSAQIVGFHISTPVLLMLTQSVLKCTLEQV
ncbi:uncharacterized protein LOC110849143 isoform X1 [Folsomia candida]|uniref:uncharacterized protein LOC110849143 isoform X1 n=1 Tax=Folsomia candida TaxID=158441 RepID=UPI001604DEC5|nr:uncharacterized protein LOC110849143 isoform X1 [Folsomia candida]